MPPRFYPLAHPEAQLNPGERDALIAGLEATLKGLGRIDVSDEREEDFLLPGGTSAATVWF